MLLLITCRIFAPILVIGWRWVLLRQFMRFCKTWKWVNLALFDFVVLAVLTYTVHTLPFALIVVMG